MNKAGAKNNLMVSPPMVDVGTERRQTGVGTNEGEERDNCVDSAGFEWGTGCLEAMMIWLEDVGDGPLGKLLC